MRLIMQIQKLEWTHEQPEDLIDPRAISGLFRPFTRYGRKSNTPRFQSFTAKKKPQLYSP
jgi:hypothetical protein